MQKQLVMFCCYLQGMLLSVTFKEAN